MRNITFSAEEGLIEAARRRAAEEQTTLNAQFQRWLADYGKRLPAPRWLVSLPSRRRTSNYVLDFTSQLRESNRIAAYRCRTRWFLRERGVPKMTSGRLSNRFRARRRPK